LLRGTGAHHRKGDAIRAAESVLMHLRANFSLTQKMHFQANNAGACGEKSLSAPPL